MPSLEQQQQTIIFSQLFPDSSNLSNALEILMGGGVGEGKSRGCRESGRLCIYRLFIQVYFSFTDIPAAQGPSQRLKSQAFQVIVYFTEVSSPQVNIHQILRSTGSEEPLEECTKSGRWLTDLSRDIVRNACIGAKIAKWQSIPFSNQPILSSWW